MSVVTSPAMIAPWIAAPIATASIGSIPLSGSLFNRLVINCLTIGIRVGPPIKIILSMSAGFSFESSIACSIGVLHLSIIGLSNSSNFDLERVITKFLGPVDAS